jgi:hypothetical protein
MSYTDAEITAAVEKIVRTSLRREYGALGNRRVDQTFSDLQDAAAGVFILFSNAPFYVVLLAARRLQKAIETEQALIEDFIETVEATNRNVTPITSLSPLANAKTALTNLATASAQRTTDFADIEDVSAFQRFEDNTQRFLDESSKNVVQSGDIVQTPAEARGNLAGLFRSLRTQHADVVRRAALLEGAIDDFNTLSLAKTLSENILANSRTVIDDTLEELEGLSEKDRLAIIRRVTLDILAARSAVRNFGSISGPTTFLTLEGNGSVFADATHEATPASVTSDLLGPYAILSDTRDIDVTLEGGTPPTTTIQVLGSFVALVEATLAEVTYDIGQPNGAATPIENAELRLELLNYPSVGVDTTVDVTFSTNPAKHIGECIDEINAVVSTLGSPRVPLVAEPYVNPLVFSGLVDITAPGGTFDADIVPVNPSVDFTTFGLKLGDPVIVTDPTSAHINSIYILAVSPTAALLELTQVYPPVPTGGNELSKTVEIGGGSKPLGTHSSVALRLRISDTRDTAKVVQPVPPFVDYRQQALDDRVAISVPVVGFTVVPPPESPDNVQFQSATTIGLYPGISAVSRLSPAQDIVDGYNLSAQAAVAGSVVTSAEAVFVAQYYSGRGRTDPFDPLKLIASIFQGNGDVTSVGTTATFAVSGAATAGATAGDLVVVRSHSLAAEVNEFGVITSVGDSSIVATMSVTITPETGIDIEVGPDLSAVGFDPTAVVSGGSFNDGAYEITSIGSIPIELNLGVQVPTPIAAGNQPVVVTLEVGRYGVKFSSLDTSLSTSIEIAAISANSAASKFFSSLPVSDVGETKYFQLPEFPKDIEEDDILERNVTAVAAPDTTHTITGLEESNLLIEIDPELPTDTVDIVMDKDSPVPFARIRKQRLNTFLTLQDSLETWGALSNNQALFFTNFSRLLNPLAIDSNPTIVEVNDVRLALQSLNATLVELDGYLGTYEADEVIQVDSLIEGFQQKGADRAVDTILEAQFSVFFGMDQDELSYAGNVQKRIREINREDLPVRKDRLVRGDRSDGILSTYDEVDFEFDQSDIDTSPEPDIPIGADIEWPERAY